MFIFQKFEIFSDTPSMLRHQFSNERWGGGGRVVGGCTTFLSYSVNVSNIFWLANRTIKSRELKVEKLFYAAFFVSIGKFLQKYYRISEDLIQYQLHALRKIINTCFRLLSLGL